MRFTDAINNARGIGVMTGAQIEREFVAEHDAMECDCGKWAEYRHGSGAYKCACGALYRTSGARIR
jgi:hypothetical protein